MGDHERLSRSKFYDLLYSVTSKVAKKIRSSLLPRDLRVGRCVCSAYNSQKMVTFLCPWILLQCLLRLFKVLSNLVHEDEYQSWLCSTAISLCNSSTMRSPRYSAVLTCRSKEVSTGDDFPRLVAPGELTNQIADSAFHVS